MNSFEDQRGKFYKLNALGRLTVPLSKFKVSSCKIFTGLVSYVLMDDKNFFFFFQLGEISTDFLVIEVTCTFL